MIGILNHLVRSSKNESVHTYSFSIKSMVIIFHRCKSFEKYHPNTIIFIEIQLIRLFLNKSLLNANGTIITV